MNTRNLFFTLYATIILFFVTACGGSGGSDSVEPEPSAANDTATVSATDQTVIASQPSPSYDSDVKLLSESAETSMQLYVENGFTFDSNKTIAVYIAVNDSTGNPAANTLIKTYSVPLATESWDDLRTEDMSLLRVGKTNLQGVLDMQIDATPDVEKLLVVVSTIGIANKAILEIIDGRVNYQF